MLCLRNLYHKKHWAQQGSKPGSFTHSTDYIHILRRNHLAEEINMKGAAANPLCDLAREAPRAWEIKTPLAVEILPVNDLHPPLGVAPAYFLQVSFFSISDASLSGEENWTSGCLLYKLFFYESPAIISRVCLMELPGDRDLSCSTWLKRKALTGCLHTRTGCCRQHKRQIFRVLPLNMWAEPKATHGDDMLLFRISDLWCVLSDFSLRTWIRLTGCLQGFACTHQLTSAPPWPAGAPQPCLTCWHLKPALNQLKMLKHFLYP